MCCTLQPARLSSTILYATSTRYRKPGWDEARLVHVLGYQNKAESQGPNAMILPLPTKAELGRENMLDMTEAPRVFEAYIAARTTRMLGAALQSSPVDVFSKGSYTVVLAREPGLMRCSKSRWRKGPRTQIQASSKRTRSSTQAGRSRCVVGQERSGPNLSCGGTNRWTQRLYSCQRLMPTMVGRPCSEST
jgi:hypothetical protein